MRRKIIDQNGLNFVTFTIVDWIDLFTRKVYAEIFIDSLRYCQQNKDLVVYAYVIMSSHVHLIISTENETGLSPIIQSLKSFTAKRFLEYLKSKENVESRREWLLDRFSFNARKNKSNSDYQVWQTSNHPVVLFSPRAIRKNVNYIHLNPVEAGIVEESCNYRFSSAGDYEGEKGLIDVELLEINNAEELGYVYTGL